MAAAGKLEQEQLAKLSDLGELQGDDGFNAGWFLWVVGGLPIGELGQMLVVLSIRQLWSPLHRSK